MKIGIQTWGSQGDIRPFLALAEGLQTAGHDVTLAVTEIGNYMDASLLSGTGLNIRTVASPVIGDRDQLRRIEAQIFGQADPIRQTQAIIEQLLLPVEAAMYDAAEQLCAENDLVIGHFFHYPLSTAATLSGRSYVSVALVHSTIHSRFHPPSGLPHLGTLGNRVLWSLVRSALNKHLKAYSDRLRLAHGVSPARDLLDEVWASKQLTLVAVSPQICRPMNDWPDHYKVCGFLNRPLAALEGMVSDELQAFLAEGDAHAPVYMSFGSAMAGGDPAETITILTEAAAKASVRAVIQAPGWQKHGFNCGPTVHYVDAAPHAAIFPECKAIVHHGGAGTAQSALLAGKPAVAVTHTSEQVFWGRELARMGVAAKPLSRRGLNAERLANSIRSVIDSTTINTTARRIGMAMTGENGVDTAVRLIADSFSA